MFVWWLIIALFLQGANLKCIKNKIQLWSPTKCEAGLRFFVRLNTPRQISQPYLHPWLAEINIQKMREVESCTGVLINNRYVLTTQDCILAPIQSNQITVHLGFFNGFKQDITEMFQPRVSKNKVIGIIRYPYYEPNNTQTVENNIGLLKLDNVIKYSKTIYPIQLPAPADKLLSYDNVLGENVEWSFFPPNDKKLTEVKVNISTEKCKSININYNLISNGIICAVNIDRNIKPCGLENGGLLTTVKHKRLHNVTVLVGITATKLCQNSAPRVYVRIDNKLEWIRANTQDAAYCHY